MSCLSNYRRQNGNRAILRSRTGQGLVQVALSVALLAILALLIANVYIINLAHTFNSKLCSSAAQAGALIAQRGGDKWQIMQAVQDMVNEATGNRSLIFSPSLQEIRFDSFNGCLYLVVSITTGARLPAPLLVLHGNFDTDGRLVFYKTCIVNLQTQT